MSDRRISPTLTLRQDGAAATLLPTRGGLLSALTLKRPGQTSFQEILWTPPDFQQGDASEQASSGWPGGGAPWLFPFAGRVFHEGQVGRYHLDGEVYNMPIHGFAYGARWEVADHRHDSNDSHRAVLTLKSGEASRQLYPFDFTLRATYELSAHSLLCTLKVTAADGNGKPMPVAVGMHPYFHADFTATQLTCAAGEEIRVTPTGAAGKATPLSSDATPSFDKAIDDIMVHNLILGKLRNQQAQLVDTKNHSILSVTAKPSELMRHFVLWAKPEQGFYCVEPWMGLPDAVSTGAGSRWLEAGESLEVSVEISLST